MPPKKKEKPVVKEHIPAVEVKPTPVFKAPVLTKLQLAKKDMDPRTERLFEAPDGEILKGSKDAGSLYYRKMDIYIQPLRESIPFK